MPLGKVVGLGPGHIVIDGDPCGDPAPPQQPLPTFSPYAYCGQTVGCIRIPLGTEVGLIPGNIVLDGDPAPLRPPRKEGTAASTFRPTLLWNGRPSQQLLSCCISFNLVKSYFHSSFTAEERRKLPRKLYKLFEGIFVYFRKMGVALKRASCVLELGGSEKSRLVSGYIV